jgi:hypothetical protein
VAGASLSGKDWQWMNETLSIIIRQLSIVIMRMGDLQRIMHPGTYNEKEGQ